MVGAGAASLQVRDLVVRFGEALALDRVDLDVAAGEVLALLGPSGCGKTTLLRVVAGLQAPTAGRVVLDGVDLAPVPPHRRGIGFMFQDYALFPHRDVAANVGFGLEVRSVSRSDRRARVDELLELVGLTGYGDRPIEHLSGGERQRVALARALAPAPGVLLLDEPLGALDRSLRDRLVLELRAIFDALGVTAVLVTHDQAEALAVADRVAVLESGRVVQAGPPGEVWGHPASESVARLVGRTNIVPVTVADGVVRAPWGELGAVAGASAATRQVVVRTDGIELVAPGPAAVAGRVVGRTFRGDRLVLRVEVAGPVALDVAVDPAGAPPDGTGVAVSVDPAAVVALGDRGSAAPTADVRRAASGTAD